MADTPDNLILAQLREMRREIDRGVESSQACMRSVARMYERFAEFHDEIVSLRSELATFRAETLKTFIKLEGDLVHLENQNISRHGESLDLIRRLGAWEQQLMAVPGGAE